jgi:energy-coupling factor transporter transmembrane protein EcfT
LCRLSLKTADLNWKNAVPESAAAKLVPQAKVIICFLGILACAVIPAERLQVATIPGLFLAVLLCIGHNSSPLTTTLFLKRWLLAAPTILFFAAAIGWSRTWQTGLAVAVRGLLSAGFATWLLSSGERMEWLRGLESLGAPRILISIATATTQQLDVILAEARRMRQAARNRLGPSGWRQAFPPETAAALLGSLLGRSLSRANRVQEAMEARGFSRTLPLHPGPPMNVVSWLSVAGVAVIAAITWAASWI